MFSIYEKHKHTARLQKRPFSDRVTFNTIKFHTIQWTPRQESERAKNRFLEQYRNQ